MTDKLRQAAQQAREPVPKHCLKEIAAGRTPICARCNMGPCPHNTAAPQPAKPAEQCWKCGDLDPAGHAKCNVPACGMREDTQPAIPPGYKLVPVSLLEDLAPAEPVNDDETGGCVFCGGRPAGKPFGDASSDPSDHRPGCPWVKIRALLSGTAPQPAKQEPLTDEEMGKIINAHWGVSVWEMARAIERAHGIGEQP